MGRGEKENKREGEGRRGEIKGKGRRGHSGKVGRRWGKKIDIGRGKKEIKEGKREGRK